MDEVTYQVTTANRCNHSKKHNSNHLSVHQWIRSAIRDSQQSISPIGFLFLKLPPPPCAELLVYCIYIYLQYSIYSTLTVCCCQSSKQEQSNHAEDVHILSPVIPLASGRWSRCGEFSNVLSAVISEHREQLRCGQVCAACPARGWTCFALGGVFRNETVITGINRTYMACPRDCEYVS